MTVLRFLRMADFPEIDKAALNIHSIQLNMHPVTDIQTLKAIDQFAVIQILEHRSAPTQIKLPIENSDEVESMLARYK